MNGQELRKKVIQTVYNVIKEGSCKKCGRQGKYNEARIVQPIISKNAEWDFEVYCMECYKKTT